MNIVLRGFFAFWWLVIALVCILMLSVSGRHIIELWDVKNDAVWAIVFLWMLAAERSVQILGSVAVKIFHKERAHG